MVWMLWMVFFVGRASADVPAVTLEEAAASARLHASGVEIAQAQHDAATARHEQVVDSRLPSIGVNGAVNVYPTGSSTRASSLRVTESALDCGGPEHRRVRRALPDFQGLLDAFGDPDPDHEP